MVSAYGWSGRDCLQGLLSDKSAIGSQQRFRTDSFVSDQAALVPGLQMDREGKSLVMQMLQPLLRYKDFSGVDRMFLATTLGEIEYLESSVLNNRSDEDKSDPVILQKKLQDMLQIKAPGTIVSAACASSGVAIARAADMIKRSSIDSALVLACDSVSEFIFSGFSSLMALDPNPARPFDANRQGLNIGEAAGYVLLMSERRAEEENLEILGTVAGWGLSSDAHHMTGPIPDGSGLARAIESAIYRANLDKGSIGSICAHGTGTPLNDSMEIQAVKRVFEHPLPMYSIKGGTGHTMGAAGLIETIITLLTLQKQQIPRTVNCNQVGQGEEAWINRENRPMHSPCSLSINSGFGGTNCALVLERRN